jgi:hypothetical protein
LASVICSDNPQWGGGAAFFRAVQTVARTRKRFIALTKFTSGCFDLPTFSGGVWTSAGFGSIVTKMRGTLRPRQKVYRKQPL